MKTLALLCALACAAPLFGDGPGVMSSQRAKSDFALTADPNSKNWKKAPAVIAENSPLGKPVPNHRTEIRSRWTNNNLYFLFICPYENLHLKPNPVLDKDTWGLWEWDVAEVFIGANLDNINLYQEFEVSPKGEWIDLDIDRAKMNAQGGAKWDSGFENKTRIVEANKIWYVEMRIPIGKIDKRKPVAGNEFRLNLYRCQDKNPGRKYIAWQPTGNPSFHTPKAFGRLRLVK